MTFANAKAVGEGHGIACCSFVYPGHAQQTLNKRDITDADEITSSIFNDDFGFALHPPANSRKSRPMLTSTTIFQRDAWSSE
jgi:hypothetical protein